MTAFSLRDSRIPRLLALAALCAGPAVAEPLRYSGSLLDEGTPADGAYALRMSLYDASTGGRRVGEEITLLDVAVAGGGFSADVDFGLPQPVLDRLWLQVEVAGADGSFEALGARESLDAKAMAAAACWATTGNAGTSSLNDFIGTLDNQALVFKANAQEILRLDPDPDSPNVIAGVSDNSSTVGTMGATVSGGGLPNDSTAQPLSAPNRVYDNFGTVAGGMGNRAGLLDLADLSDVGESQYATVSGGFVNHAEGGSSVVAGGSVNIASGVFSAIAGGYENSALGYGAFVPGGRENKADANFSFAGGFKSVVREGDVDSFVWGTNMTTSGSGQFLVEARGGAAINGNPPRESRELTVWGNGAIDSNVDIHLRPFQSVYGYSLTVDGVSEGTTNFALRHTDGNANTQERLRVAANGDFSVTAAAFKPGGGSWSVASDARLKKHVAPLDGALERLLQLRGVSYEYRTPDTMRPAGVHHGFIAQEVQPVFPRWVSKGEDGYLTVAPQGFEALAVEALRELAEENALLRDQLEQIERRLAASEGSAQRRAH